MENLNKEQLEAVTHKNGPLLIVAGAGTGKTTVITQRIAYIIEQGRAKSEEILALTFTEKAADEMEERVDRLLPMGYLDLWISTFHSFGERILRENGLDIGLPADFKLLNEFEQYALIKNNLDKFNLDYYQPLGNPTKFIRALVSHFSRLKDEDIGTDEYLKYAEGLRENMDNMLNGGKDKSKKLKKNIAITADIKTTGYLRRRSPRFAPPQDNSAFTEEIATQEVARINEVANAYHVYNQLLLDNASLDFGDLINYTLKLFRERLAILEKYRQQFKYILLDEFQDTNWAQYELIKLLTNPKNNLVVVGDDDQSIYKFRGASVSNILQFKKDFPGSKQIFLVKNYRNQQNILDLSYEFIQQNDPNRLEYQLSKKLKVKSKKLSKRLFAQEKGQGVIEVISGNDLQDEVKQVVEKIADLKIQDKKSSWNDFAILVRANESAKDFCNALDIAGLPYQFLSSRGLYAKPVIMDVISYLKLLDDYHESMAVFRILNLPIFKFTQPELVNLNYLARKKALSLFTVLKDVNGKLGKEVQIKIDQALNLISKHTALTREKDVREVILAFLNDSGYLKHLTSQAEQKSREEVGYLKHFIKRVQIFEANSDDKSVRAFLAEFQIEIDAGEQGSLPFDPDSGPEAIKIMTVHGAKGLEFKYVFISNMVDKRFPTIERREAIKIPDELVKEILPEGDIHLEEERRLFYVAMTRAREQIYFSWASDYGGVRKKRPSRFLAELKLIKVDEKKKVTKAETLAKISPKPNIKKDSTATDYKLPFYLSYSQLSAFSSCPYKYRFSYVLKVPTRGKYIFSFGKTMHLTLQKLFELLNEKKGLGQGDLFGGGTEGNLKRGQRDAKISLDEIIKIYEGTWIDSWYDTEAQKEKYRKLGKNILKEFYNKHKDNWPETILLEKNFNIKIKADKEYYTVRGAIDRVDKINNKVKIIDYKTGRPKKKLTAEDKEQLLIYQLAIQDLFKYEVDCLSFYYLDNNSEIEFLGTDKELEKIKVKIISNIREIRKGEFLPKPGPLCAFCDFREICEFRKT